jgi:demethylmenaquinone methyltransferase/2-methoxy-6-polyprenyl-1,4-benzoquinol methylase
MPNRQEALKKYGEGEARHFYDTAVYDTADPIREWRRSYIARLALKPGETVLDVGCGTGASFAFLEEGVGPGGRVIGIDQSPEQLAVARALIERSDWRNVTLIQSPVEDAEIPDPADAALFSYSHDIQRTPRALENVLNSLKPGGRIVVVGMRWMPWWNIAVNFRTWRFGRNFITTFEGFRRPWNNLEKLVSSIEVESLVPRFGTRASLCGTYIAVARK